MRRILLVTLLVLMLVLLATCAALATTPRAPTNVDIIRGSPPTISPYTRAEGTSYVADLTRGSPGTSTATIVGTNDYFPKSCAIAGASAGTARADDLLVENTARAGGERVRGTPVLGATPHLPHQLVHFSNVQDTYDQPAAPIAKNNDPGARQMEIKRTTPAATAT